MKPFWNPELNPSPAAMLLLQMVMEAHYTASFRGNLSSNAVGMSAHGAGDFFKAVIAGCSMLGAEHGPVIQAIQMLTTKEHKKAAKAIVRSKGLVPGWGSSFVKREPDPDWEGVDTALLAADPELHQKIVEITATLHTEGKILYPNPACYTAAAAIVLQIPPQVAPWIFLAGRLNAWGKIFLDNRPSLPRL